MTEKTSWKEEKEEEYFLRWNLFSILFLFMVLIVHDRGVGRTEIFCSSIVRISITNSSDHERKHVRHQTFSRIPPSCDWWRIMHLKQWKSVTFFTSSLAHFPALYPSFSLALVLVTWSYFLAIHLIILHICLFVFHFRIVPLSLSLFSLYSFQTDRIFRVFERRTVQCLVEVSRYLTS